MNTSLNILIISQEYPPDTVGGLGTHVNELATGLATQGCRVTVVCYSPVAAVVEQIDNVTVHRLTTEIETGEDIRSSLGRQIVNFNQILVEYGRQLIEGMDYLPDIIHCHDWFFFSASHQLGQIFHIPTVATLHFLTEPIIRWWGGTPDDDSIQWERTLFAEAEALITVSQSMRAIIQATHNVPATRIHVVYNGLAPHRFRPPATRPPDLLKLRRLVAPPEATVVLFAGRLDPQKGIEALFAAAAEVVAVEPDIYYLIAGEADSRALNSYIQDQLSQYPALRARLKLLGKVPREQLAKLYQIADLAVVPSIYEAFGYVAIEAMVAGVPVVASAVGGLAEIITHEVTGLLVPVHQPPAGIHQVDVSALATAQLRLARDRTLARQLGLAGQQHVLATFTLDHMVQATLQVYRQTAAAF